MKLGYNLTIEQTQKLAMTPELIQAIQILQFNTQELNQYVQEELLTNPCLDNAGNNENDDNSTAGEVIADESVGEMGHLDEIDKIKDRFDDNCDESSNTEFDWQEHIKNRDYDDISYRQSEYNKDRQEYSYEKFAINDVTLTENLQLQLQGTSLWKNCREIGQFIIEAIDDNGYLTLSTEEIANITCTPLERIEKTLKIIQNFEPVGVGGRNLKECLIIQIRNDEMLEDEEIKFLEKLVMEHLEDIASNRLSVIAKSMKLSILQIQEMCDYIKTLEPKPGRQFANGTDTKYIVPDILVDKIDGEYIVSINETSTPRLAISSYYEKLLEESKSDLNLSKYLSNKVNSAIWLIKSIEQRKQTIYNVVSAVVKYQNDFFDKGSKFLKTLTLKQIAEEVGVHESTVSRAINGKYMQSPRGVFEVRYFFTSGVSGEDGGGVSSNSIKSMIKDIVDCENPKAPLSDQDMVLMLTKEGIEISRRTVAKYRDEMNILSSSKRRRY